MTPADPGNTFPLAWISSPFVYLGRNSSWKLKLNLTFTRSTRISISCHIISSESSVIYCWVFDQWLNIPIAFTCLLTSGSIWITGQYACGSKRNIESLAKYPTINYTAFGWNNSTKFFNYQILADRFVLNLKVWKNSRCYFSCWCSTVGHEIMTFARH